MRSSRWERKLPDNRIFIGVYFSADSCLIIHLINHPHTAFAQFLKDLVTGAHPELKQYIDEENQKSFAEIRKMFAKAQKDGQIRSDLKIEFIMYMLMKMREVFKDENIQKLYPDTTSFMKEAFNLFYYGVLSRKK